jgi:LmbE family N-acetylglucosaminyl deacetylase
MRLLAVMAHPDDAELWCGGTLLRHVHTGDEVRIAVLTGQAATPRWVEAEEGARQLGCAAEPLGLADTAIRDTEPAVTSLTGLLRSYWPDIILTHWFDDMHPDHEAAFRLVRRALLRACLEAEQNDLSLFPRTFCCDTYQSRGLRGPFQPDRYVDVTEVWEAKLAALRAHASQYLAHYEEMISGQGVSHGQTAGVAWAEGFLHIPLFGRQDEGFPLGGRHAIRLPQTPGPNVPSRPDNLAQ